MPLRSYLRCMKLESTLIIASGIFLGMALSGGSLQIPIGVFLALFFMGGVLSGGVQALNMYFDREIDELVRPERPLPKGELDGGQVLRFSILLISISVSASIFWVALGGKISVLLCVLAGAALGISYSVPPLSLGRKWYSAYPSASFAYVFIPIIAGGSVFGLDQFTMTAALFFTALSIFISPLKDCSEVKGDELCGKKTLPTEFGIENTLRITLIGSASVVVTFLSLGLLDFKKFFGYVSLIGFTFVLALLVTMRIGRERVFEVARVFGFASQLIFAWWST